jgi:serine/threonine protein kinase
VREGEVTEGDVIGGYRLLAPLGEGGMGTVWRAEQTRLGRHAAVKVIRHDLASDPEFRRRFEAEARAAAAIDHPNVVTVFDAGEAAGALYLAMALVEGGTLRELLDRDGRLEPARAVELVRQIGDGLDAVHAAGLVHRDVKPGNVLLGDGGRRAQITDFGVAKLVGGSGVTRTGSMVGTLDYLAPEQVLDRPVDARTDVYALGCLLFELLCGHVPFAREAAPARMWAHVHDPPPRVSEAAPVATTFDAVIARAMAKEPGERHASAGALAAAAGRALAGTADGGAPPTAFAWAPRRRAPRRVSRRGAQVRSPGPRSARMDHSPCLPGRRGRTAGWP